MSVIVTCMEMPERCETCDLIYDNDYGFEVCCCTGEVIDRKEQARPRFCPLRPLPVKHGRIVDAGPLEVVAYSLKDHEGESFDEGVGYILEKLDALPAIVEAKGDN